MSGVIRGKTDVSEGASRALPFDITNPPPWISEVWQLAESRGTGDEIKRVVHGNGHGPVLNGMAAGINQVVGWEGDIADRRAAELTLAYVRNALEASRGAALYRDCKERWDAAAPGAFLAYEIARSLELPMPGAIFTSAALRSYRPLLTPWQFPRCIDEPIRFFARPFGAGAYFLPTAAIHVADKLALAEDWTAALDLIQPKVLDLLGVDPERMTGVRTAFTARPEAIDDFRALLP
ncbi:MAG: hypothetical protein HKN20_10370 [Gemmatimonadetes bacterium]|nr:hypothetical protein [Gemmatimonadota bacterium]